MRRARRGAALPGGAPGLTPARPPGEREIEQVFRQEYGRAVSVLDPGLRRHRPGGGRGAGRLHGCRGAVARGRPAPEPGRVDHHHGSAPDPRPPAPGGVPRRPSGAGDGVADPIRRDRRGVRRGRRPPAPHLHLLSPGAGAGGPGRVDAAPARWPLHAGDRPCLHGARTDHGAAHRPRQGEDPRRHHPLPGPQRRRAARPAARRPGRGLSRLQRGLRRHVRAMPWSGRTSAPKGFAWPARCTSSCRTSPRWWACWPCSCSLPPGVPHAREWVGSWFRSTSRTARSGTRSDRRGSGARPLLSAEEPSGSVSDTGGHQCCPQ